MPSVAETVGNELETLSPLVPRVQRRGGAGPLRIGARADPALPYRATMLAHVQYRRGLPVTEGCYQAWRALEERGWDVRPFGRVEDLDPRPEVPVIGGVPQVVAALGALGIHPGEVDYPDGLRPFLLDPELERTTLGAVRRTPERWPLFVKPTTGWKEFTGRVIHRTSDLLELVHVDDEASVFASRAVDVRAGVEWRCFVIDGELRDVRPYTRITDAPPPPRSFLAEVVEAWAERPAGCCIDVIDLGAGQGDWRVIECNDGFALGTYGLRREVYAELLVKRWGELTGASDLWTP